ncbi:MAG: TetR/AcrR family transcriptional regulator, partial [Mycobacterium sp.]|uniref:TetR family transcriptional regulator n=1 Tax=Mycobacterium sp. TaxID=1785 RepID=UPI003C776D83
MNVTALDEHENVLSIEPAAPSRQRPATVRGARTRAALIAAARKVFERDGYVDCKLTDITKAAKCATGSFYTYFANKAEIFAAVLEEAQRD